MLRNPSPLATSLAAALRKPRRRLGHLGQIGALSAAIATVLASSGELLAAAAVFDGDAAVGTAGDNVTWANASNWTTGGVMDTAPSNAAPGDDLTFGGGTAGGVIDLGGARFANTLTFNRNYTLGLASTTNTLTLATTTVSVTSGNTGTINAVLAGSAGLSLSGGGTLFLNRATGNTFTGNITVDGAGTTLAYLGTNSSADPTALGAAGARTITLTNGGAISVAGGTLSNPTAGTKSFVIGTGGGTIDTASGQTLQLDDAGQFSGTATLTKTGAGTLFLNTQAFTYTGSTVNINGGTLRVGANAGVLGAGTVAINVASGATYDNLIGLTGTKNITVAGTGVGGNGALIASSGTTGTIGGTVTMTADTTFGGAGNLTIGGVVSGAFNVSKVGGGTTILTGANTYSGNTTISGGAIRAAFGTGLPSTTNVVLNGGAFEATANFAGTLGTGASEVQLPGGASGFSAGAAGTINISLNGGPTLVWGSTPNFNPSALVLNQPSALGTLDFQNAIDLNGAARTFAGNGPIANPGVVSGPITSTGGPVAVTIGNGGAGVVQLTNTGNTGISSLTLTSGELGISSHDNINGTTTPITFNGGGLQVNGTAIATFPDAHPVTFVASKPIGFDVTTAGHTLTVPSSFPATTTTFTKNGAGTLALTAASNQFVTLQMNGGTLDLGTGAYTIANVGNNVIQSTGGGTINATGGGTLTLSSASATDGGNIGTANGTTLTINAPIISTGTGAFEVFSANNGTGVVALTANNTFAGNVFINSNVVSVPSIGNSGASGPLGQGSTINIGNSTTTTGTLRYTGTGETNDRVLNLRGTTAGATVEMAGTGTLTFTSNVTATGAGIKTLNLIGSTAGVGEIAGIIPNNSATNTTSIFKNGTGTWKLSGANTFTGGVNINQGSLIITNSSALGTGTKTITLTNGTAGNPQLVLDGSAGDITLPNTFTYPTSNVTAGSGAFVNVAGNNTIQGTINPTSGGGDTAIVVNGGSLTIAANVSTATTGLGVRALRLRGVANGSLSGVINNGSSTVGITQEGSGTWAITGNSNTYSGATNITSGTLLANNISGSATGTSTVTVSGTGTLGGSGFITGPVAVNTGGTIAPGGSPGILSIGNATFGGGTFALELNGITPGTGYDRLNVTGTVSLTADSPISISLGFTPSNNQTFIVLSNDGADSISTAAGLFTNAGIPLSEGAIFTVGGQQFSISYAGGDGNDVAVVAVPEPGAFGAILSGLGLIAGFRRRRA